MQSQEVVFQLCRRTQTALDRCWESVYSVSWGLPMVGLQRKGTSVGRPGWASPVLQLELCLAVLGVHLLLWSQELYVLLLDQDTVRYELRYGLPQYLPYWCL